MKTLKSPSRTQRSEFDRFWQAEKGPFLRMAKRETEQQVKARIFDMYVEAWRNQGFPRRFLPEPMLSGYPTFKRLSLADFDQDLFPNRKWIL